MQKEIRQDKIIGSRRFSNYFWAIFLCIGGLSFLLAVFQVTLIQIYYHLQIQQNWHLFLKELL